MSRQAEDTVFHARSPDGTDIGCVVEGEGPPLVMVHGTGDTHAGWRRVRPLLAKHFTLYLMDRRGRGVSGDRDAYALEREWEDVAAVIDAIDVPLNVFGHSFGAMCVLHGAPAARNVRRICVYEPSVNRNVGNPVREAAVEAMADCIGRGDREAAVITYLRDIIRVPAETLEKQRAQADAWQSRLRMAHTMPRELLALRSYRFDAGRFTHLPLHVLVGSESAAHSQQTARELGPPVTLQGQGHFAMLGAPELLAGTLVEIFKGSP